MTRFPLHSAETAPEAAKRPLRGRRPEPHQFTSLTRNELWEFNALQYTVMRGLDPRIFVGSFEIPPRDRRGWPCPIPGLDPGTAMTIRETDYALIPKA